MNKSLFTSLTKVLFNKAIQTLLNVTPFLTALFFIDQNYLRHYKILTLIFFFITLGNFGTEKLFTSKQLNIEKTMKTIVFGRVISCIIFIIIGVYNEFNIAEIGLSSLIILVNYNVFFEFIFIGDHSKNSFSVLKIIVILIGISLRLTFVDHIYYLMILLLESFIFYLILKSSIKRKDNFFNTVELKYIDYLHTTFLLVITFVINKCYLYFLPLDFNSEKLKFLHFFDYVVFIASVLSNVILKLEIKLNNLSLITIFLLLVPIFIIASFVFNLDTSSFYIYSKILSAFNVFMLTIIFSNLKVKIALFVNLLSLLTLVSFFILNQNIPQSIFVWMFIAETSVVVSLLLFEVRDKYVNF